MSGPFATARVREMTLATQGFLFFTMANAYKVFAYESMSTAERSLASWLHLLVIFSPFIIARIAPLMAVMPPLLLRDEARISVDARGLLYQFDSVKRPLFAPWSAVASIERTRFGMVIQIRPNEALFEGMPKFQGEFWRAKTRRAIRLGYVDRLAPDDGLRVALRAARREGVTIKGFDAGGQTRAAASAATR